MLLCSQLHCNFPFAICKTAYLRKYGIKKLIKQFVNVVNRHCSPEGVVFQIWGCSRVFRGALLAMRGDTLAPNFIRGLKEGVCFPQDIMHILFEGLLAKEIQLLLKYCCENHFLSINQQNQSISYLFDYGYHKLSNKPSIINSLDKVSQLAYQWWCLCRYLPLIGQYIPACDSEWHCFSSFFPSCQF